MIESTITGIFQTPVYKTVLKKKFNKKELAFMAKDKKSTQKHSFKPRNPENESGNYISSNKYVLDEKVFKNLKKELELVVQDYFNKIVCPATKVTPYITQSWFNYTEHGEWHHVHSHANSYISGVFYIDCHKELDRIKFFSHTYQQIRPEVSRYNVYNALTWWFPVRTNEVILFPSSLTHGVEMKKGHNTRTSLAFNVFVKGTMGRNQNATELILK
jgi:uncharacterized protein (TIGR02466 family)|tara:strand:+ start:1772 stop:2419 length:648 start_codon:yes stop_codon:yes gene_type:complete